MIYQILLLLLLTVPVALASTDKEEPKKHEWSFEGMLGVFDRQSIERGFQVYKEVCSACHGVTRIAFRNLKEIGFSDAEIKTLAATYQIPDGPNAEGEMFERPGKPSDYIPSPYPNEQAARAANNNAYPPDLSLIIKAREDGANYVFSLLTGYETSPEGFEVGENMHYNPYFSGGGKQFAMPPPLTSAGQVQYGDGTESSIEQMSHDVVNFLQWGAEPEMEKRKSTGVKALLFLVIFTLFFIALKRKVWKQIK